ncbi:hypothetical protein CDV55_101573 [Aspergillus turcosus]|uniref:Enoyl reductase (ER) domain-containing protein n=1 Tax=Aspergillus turcosus TaxID=1245748 RepID=A0A229YI07_9EURO|nr:hypothetical protein CDV55_101573 [Aspergillus turcosus]RLL95726.1 hypothetical protein CFD26_105249 [Aspergillus turcosus]
MKALVFTGPNQIEVQDHSIPVIESPTDAIVKLTHTTICGTDLHILKGDVPTVEPGRILGHEGVGSIASIGSAVNGFYAGDTVLISCITACGVCPPCRKGLSSHCTSGGWILGNIIDGTQAEYVRIPHATSSLFKLPGMMNPQTAVTLSDSFPTGMECGTINACVQPGNTVAIVGAGPVGLAAMLTAKLYTPSRVVVIDIDDTRLGHAKRLGADEVINPNAPGAMEVLDTASGDHGFDSVIEAVGNPKTFELCQRLVAPGGSIANVGVHGQKVDLELDKLWDRNICIRTRLVDAVTIPTLVQLSQCGKLDPAALLTHSFSFSHILDAYKNFQAASEHGTLKVGIYF